MAYYCKYSPNITVSNEAATSSGNIKLDIDDIHFSFPIHHTIGVMNIHNHPTKRKKIISDKKIMKMIQMRK